MTIAANPTSTSMGFPENDSSGGHFAPFSIITTEIKDFGKGDKAYIELRDFVMHTVFPETIDIDEFRALTERRKLAGNAIRPILNLALLKNKKHPWYTDAVAHTSNLGIDIIPGKGVTFARPSQFSNRRIVGNHASRTSKPGITQTLLTFVKLHTK